MKNLLKQAVWLIALIMGLYGGTAHSQFVAPYIDFLEFNSDIDYHAGFNIDHNDVVVVDPSFGTTSNVTPLIISSIRGAVVDGYHKDNTGLKYFSFDVDTIVAGVGVLKSDIIRCTDTDCLSTVLIFDSGLTNTKHININSFTFDPSNGELIFSIGSDAFISGAPYLAADLIRYDGAVFSLEYNSTLSAFSRYQDIDGLSMTDNGRYLVSFANSSNFNDIYGYDISTLMWSLAYTPFNDLTLFNNINVSSLMVHTQVVPDLMFSDGFED